MSYDPETMLRTLFDIAENADSPEHAEEAMLHFAEAAAEGEGDEDADEGAMLSLLDEEEAPEFPEWHLGTIWLGPEGDEWEAFEGKRGGKGWKHSGTGRIVYGAKKPGSRGGAKEEAAGTGAPPGTSGEEVPGGGEGGKPAGGKPAAKPRGKTGKAFASPEEAAEAIRDAMAKGLADDPEAMTEKLMTLTVADLKTLKKSLEAKMAGTKKAEMAASLAREVLAGRFGKGGKGAPAPAPEPKADPKAARHGKAYEALARLAPGLDDVDLDDPEALRAHLEKALGKKAEKAPAAPGIPSPDVAPPKAEASAPAGKPAPTGPIRGEDVAASVRDAARKQTERPVPQPGDSGGPAAPPQGLAPPPPPGKPEEAGLPPASHGGFRAFVPRNQPGNYPSAGTDGDNVRAALAEAVSYLGLFREHQDGIIAFPRLYAEMKKRLPELTIEDFRQFVDDETKRRGVNGKRAGEAHIINEVHKLTPEEARFAIRRGDNDAAYYYFIAGDGLDRTAKFDKSKVGPGKPMPAPLLPPAATAKPTAPKPAALTPAPAPAPRPASSPPGTLGAAHREITGAMQGLKQELRGGLVPLDRLRKATGLSPKEFDAAMADLRRAGKVTLSGIEGRHATTDSLRGAAIKDGNDLLAYADFRDDGDVAPAPTPAAGTPSPDVARPKAPAAPAPARITGPGGKEYAVPEHARRRIASAPEHLRPRAEAVLKIATKAADAERGVPREAVEADLAALNLQSMPAADLKALAAAVSARPASTRDGLVRAIEDVALTVWETMAGSSQ